MVALMSAGDAESAAILTPYNGQVRLIRRILKEHTGDIYLNKVQFPLNVTHSNSTFNCRSVACYGKKSGSADSTCILSLLIT